MPIKENTNKELVKALYQSLMAHGDVTIMNDLLSSNYIDHDIPGYGKGGREELKMAVLAVRESFPDIKPELYELVEEDNWVSVRVEASGHHTGKPFFNIPATGKQIRWKEIHLFRCSRNKIVEHRGVFDLLSILQQLGAISFN